MKAERGINGYGSESKHLERLFLTIIALVVVLLAVFTKAALMGEFAWVGGA